MGASSSSFLDETKANYIRGRAEAELRNFSPHYRQQYCQAQLQQLQEEVEPRRERRGQLLTQREPRGAEEVMYQDSVNYHDDSRKWKERFAVVRGNHTVEIHDNQENFTKGLAARHTLLPTGGSVLISEDRYTALVDKAFPDPNGLKEELPSVVPPGCFPVFLHLPYRPDVLFCFRQEDQQDHFLSILSTCIRHQNLGWSRGPRCEALALQRALLLYRQEKGHYESWEQQLGSDLQVLSNLVMGELLPSLQTELLPKLRGKKAERRRVWVSVVQAAYKLVQDQLREGLEALKEECRQTAQTNQALVRSDLDQILASRAFLQDKLTECVSVPAEQFCSERVVPCLASLLDELMGGISGGFLGLRRHLEAGMTSACLALGEGPGQVSKALAPLRAASLEECYQTVVDLQEKCLELRQRFRYSNTQHLIHSTQIDMQQLMENAVHTFEQLVQSAVAEQSAQLSSSVEKAKLRVLKLYDYDSSVTRRRILQEALVDITLPALRRNVAPTCKPDLQRFEQFISDYSNFIQVENVYEDILLNILSKEISKVVLEAASEQKNQLKAASHGSLSHLVDPDPKPASPKSEVSSDPNFNPDSSSDPNLNPASSVSDVSPTSLPASHTELLPEPEAPAASMSVTSGCEVIPTGREALHTASVGLASLSAAALPDTAPTAGQGPATDRAVYLNRPTAQPETQHGGAVQSDTPVEDGGTVQDDTPVEDSDAVLDDTSVEDGGTVQDDTPVEDSDAVQDETPVEDRCTVQDDTPVEDSDAVQDDTPVEDSGTDPNDTPVEVVCGPIQDNNPVDGSGTVQPDTSVDGSGTVQSDTPEDAGSGTVQTNNPVESGSGTVQTNNPVEGSDMVQHGAEGAAEGEEPVEEEPDEGEESAEGEEPALPMDSVRQIRDLVVEVIEVEDLVYRCPRGNGTA